MVVRQVQNIHDKWTLERPDGTRPHSDDDTPILFDDPADLNKWQATILADPATLWLIPPEGRGIIEIDIDALR